MSHRQTTRVLFLVLSSLCAAGCGSHYDGHGDGEMTVRLAFQVRESGTKRPVPEAQVTFFNHQEEMALLLAESERVRGDKDTLPTPTGNFGTTDASGIVHLHCLVGAAFIFKDRPGNIVRTEWWPRGFLVISKPGFQTKRTNLRDLFPKPPYTEREITRPVEIVLEREKPQQ